MPAARSTIIHSTFSDHALYVARIARAELPANIVAADGYTHFFIVRNGDANGIVFMYLGRGLPEAPREVVAWYPNGRMWSSYGTTIQRAIEGAQRDGWLRARNN